MLWRLVQVVPALHADKGRKMFSLKYVLKQFITNSNPICTAIYVSPLETSGAPLHYVKVAKISSTNSASH